MNTRANHQIQRDGRAQGRHAVVLGGSLAGLLAARVLADHFEEVTLIERDAYPDTTDTRKGIPQANHVHGLLARGREILEELFPGVQDEMIAAGAPLHGSRGATRDPLRCRTHCVVAGFQHAGSADSTISTASSVSRVAPGFQTHAATCRTSGG